MAKNWTGQTISTLGNASGFFQFGGDFDKGTTPTLLDASQAKIVKAFIENFLFFSKAHLQYGNVDAGAELLMGDGSLILRINVPTSLLLDPDPHLGANLKLDGKSIHANAGGSIFKAYAEEGLIVGGDSVGKIVLNPAGNEAAGAGSGFKDGGAAVVWTLPPSDASTDGDFIFGDANKILDWTRIVASSVADKGGIDVTFNTSSNEWEIGLDSSSSYAKGLYLTQASNGVVSGDTDITPYENYFDFVISDGLKAVGDDSVGKVTLSINSEPLTMAFLTADGGTVSGDTTIMTYENALDFIIGSGLTATGNSSVGSIKIEADAQSLTVEEIDGSPSVSDVTEIKVSNGQLTNNGGGSVTICTAQEIYLTATGTGEASGGPVGPHPGYEHYDFVAGDGMELKQATTHADGVEFIVQETTLTGDSGSDDWTPGEGINFEGGLGIVTEVTVASQPSVVTTKVDDDVCMSINGIGVGDVSANNFSISAGDNITISSDTSGITIEADKYAIVESNQPEEFVSLACTEMPEVRFDDVLKIEVGGRKEIVQEIDPLYIHVCEKDSIDAISYVCSEPSVAGIKIEEGQIQVSFSDQFPLPDLITIKLSGIRKGRAGKRFVKFTEEQARSNANFWNGWRG